MTFKQFKNRTVAFIVIGFVIALLTLIVMNRDNCDTSCQTQRSHIAIKHMQIDATIIEMQGIQEQAQEFINIGYANLTDEQIQEQDRIQNRLKELKNENEYLEGELLKLEGGEVPKRG